MSDTKGNIRARKTGNTGITEDISAEKFHKVGTHFMAIVDLQVVDKHGPDVEGNCGVEYVIHAIEPATEEDLAEHLRELSRVGYLNRAHRTGQATIDDELNNERTVADVMAAGAAHKPHPFLPVDASEDNPICDVCGALAAVAVHSEQDTLPDGDEEDEGDDLDDQAAEQIDPDTGEPWEYAGPEGQVEAVEYDVRPNASVIAKQLHVHVAGECIKNRDGQLCTPVAGVPDPFTAPA